jgi:mono/diheme cytochrome c family protein
MRQRNLRLWAFSTLAATVALLTAGALVAAPKSEALTAAESASRGRAGFRIYCSNCHGVAGKGDGKLAELLRTPPADLTVLAKDNGGTFPTDAVRQAVDGRADVAAHGNRDMPVWGVAFRQPDGPADQEAVIQAKLVDLVAFVATLQAPAKK